MQLKKNYIYLNKLIEVNKNVNFYILYIISNV